MIIDNKPSVIVKKKLLRYRTNFLRYKFGYYTLNFLSFILIFISGILTTFFLAGITDKKEVLPEIFQSSEFRQNFLIFTTSITAITSLFTSLTSVFVMKDRYIRYMKMKHMLELEIALYDAKKGIYKLGSNNDFLLYERSIQISELASSNINKKNGNIS
ncbi:DUF4231 domain-containing protein [Mycoplasma iguanae]|uniref:DUF4231 domain-containing protein n=1 Tax=Mycoplasma iguanae TaxID=292461 RepID=A0ABY5R851_9MOLU|nr:DUF4231 domain-containing protein [Mycoplasma iguanae]UVD81664.1 DUF4231 domain-containing protein [Mycoplasma iguanae]